MSDSASIRALLAMAAGLLPLALALGCSGARVQTAAPEAPSRPAPATASLAAYRAGAPSADDSAKASEKRKGDEKPAPSETAIPSPPADPGSPGGAQTIDERRQGLDRQLDKSLSAFDAMLLKEQQAAAAKRAEQAAASGGGEGDGTGEGEGGKGEGGPGGSGQKAGSGKGGRSTSGRDGKTAGERGENDGHDRSTGSPRGGSAPGRGRTTSTSPEGQLPTSADNSDSDRVPSDVGDGRDDDVVARQIREAAMKEEDPAIRERLWDEYRRYKGIRPGGS